MKKYFIRFIENNSLVWTIIVLSSCLFGFFLIINGPRIYPDSSGYIDMAPIRSSGYSVFINVFKIFGANYLWLVVFIQVFFNLFAAIFFIKFINITYNLSGYNLIVLLIPTYYIIYKYSCAITTEAIAIPLFLITCSWLFLSLYNNNYKEFLIAILSHLILMLFRSQFVFIYAVFFMALFYFFWNNKNIWKLTQYFIIIVISFLLSQFIDKTYHYYKHDKFIITPFTGIQLATEAFYIANEKDYLLFTDYQTERIFKTIYDSIYSKGYNLNAFNDENTSSSKSQQIFHYLHSYNEISHKNIKVILLNEFREQLGIEKWQSIDHLTLKMSFKLIKANWRVFLRNYSLDILVNGFHTFFNLFFFITIMLALTIGIYKKNKLAIIIWFSGIMLVMNLLLVALVEPVLFRYSIYTNYLFLMLLTTGIIKIFDIQK